MASTHREPLAGELVFWFIDEREDRVDHLREELRAMTLPAHFKVFAECGTFHGELSKALDSVAELGSQLAPAFAFIDPFGFSGIPFALIERLLKQQRTEAFITFMVDSINRFLEHPRNSIVQHIAEAFGT